MCWDINDDRASYRDHVPPSYGRSSTKEFPLPLAPSPVTVQEGLGAVHDLLSGSSPTVEDFSLFRKRRYGYLEPLHTFRDAVHKGLSRGHVDPVLVAAPENGARYGIEFRRPSRGHILLHRALKSVGRPF